MFVASQIPGIVAGHADDGAFHLGRRVEDVFVDGEKIFNVVPRLYQHTQYAVSLAAGAGGDAFGHFFLYHACTAGDEVFVVEHLEEDLARYVVGIVAGQHEGVSVEHAPQVHLQEVVFDDVVFQLRVGFAQVGHGFVVYFDHLHLPLLGQQELSEYSHAGAYFEYGQGGAGVDGVGDVLCYFQVFQEVLSQKLFRLY